MRSWSNLNAMWKKPGCEVKETWIRSGRSLDGDLFEAESGLTTCRESSLSLSFGLMHDGRLSDPSAAIQSYSRPQAC